VTIAEREALYAFLAFMMAYISRHGTPAEQAEVLEHWQEINEAFN
jgi:hypothetical protein